MPSTLPEQTRPDRPLRLAELIDVELQLQRDAELPIEVLDARDLPIAEQLSERALEGRNALRAWIDEVREPGASIGAQLCELRDLVAVVLFIVGALTGITAVGGWLLHGTGTPVNVVHFWPAVIGAQLALLLLWGLRAIPPRWLGWLPGIRALHKLLSELVGFLPWLTARLLMRGLRRERETAARALHELGRLDWLYARLRLWLVAGLTQAFAVGFNAGALGAFVMIPVVDDPAFGWRSRLMSQDDLHQIVSAIATPWCAWIPEARPSYEQIAATRYSSVDPRFATPDSDRAALPPEWAAWWPFLVASLITYGVLPRSLLWIAAAIGVRRELRRAPRDHAAYARWSERMRRLSIDTRAPVPETDAPLAASDRPEPGWSSVPARELYVLCWADVTADDASVSAQLEATGAQVRAFVRIGSIDASADARSQGEVALPKHAALIPCVVVPVWEPPLGDYLDFLRRLRAALGDERALYVVLYEPDDAALRARHAPHAEQWRKQLRALADPWLHVARWPRTRT